MGPLGALRPPIELLSRKKVKNIALTILNRFEQNIEKVQKMTFFAPKTLKISLSEAKRLPEIYTYEVINKVLELKIHLYIVF